MTSDTEKLDIRVILIGPDACKFNDLQKHFGDQFSTEAFRKIVRKLHEMLFDDQSGKADSREKQLEIVELERIENIDDSLEKIVDGSGV